VELFEFILVFFIVVVPIFGITARLAFKPMVDAIIRLRESFAGGSDGGLVERRVLELEDEVRQLRQTVLELKESRTFHRELLARPGSGDGES
jgi:hypothetical protein